MVGISGLRGGWESEFRVLGFRVQGLGFRVYEVQGV